MDQWVENSAWDELPSPAAGDIVHLKLSTGFEYLVKAIVVSVTAGQVTATIEAVFDWHTKAQITGGKKHSLVGKEVIFLPQLLHKVVKA